MAWKFDPQSLEIVWVDVSGSGNLENGLISFEGGDLEIDGGFRLNSESILDQGLRVI